MVPSPCALAARAARTFPSLARPSLSSATILKFSTIFKRELYAASQQDRRVHVRFGSKADIGARPLNVRFTPESRHWNSAARCPLCAITPFYSMTSSASAMSFTNGCILIRIYAVARKDKCDVLAARQIELKRRVTQTESNNV